MGSPKRKMTASLALAKYLVDGNSVSILTAFKLFGISNCAREISRAVEQVYGVKVTKTPKTFKSRYGRVSVYFEYSLPKNQVNKKGIQKIKDKLKELK